METRPTGSHTRGLVSRASPSQPLRGTASAGAFMRSFEGTGVALTKCRSVLACQAASPAATSARPPKTGTDRRGPADQTRSRPARQASRMRVGERIGMRSNGPTLQPPASYRPRAPSDLSTSSDQARGTKQLTSRAHVPRRAAGSALLGRTPPRAGVPPNGPATRATPAPCVVPRLPHAPAPSDAPMSGDGPTPR